MEIHQCDAQTKSGQRCRMVVGVKEVRPGVYRCRQHRREQLPAYPEPNIEIDGPVAVLNWSLIAMIERRITVDQARRTAFKIQQWLKARDQREREEKGRQVLGATDTREYDPLKQRQVNDAAQ